MYCFKCGEHIKDGSLTCSNCGATQPKVDVTPGRPVQQRPAQQQQPPLPASYIAVSWAVFAIFIVWGLIRGINGLNCGNDVETYKGGITCLAAAVFIPQIRIKSLDSVPWVVFGIKAVVATLIVWLL